MAKPQSVVIGIIQNDAQQILIAQRPEGKPMAGVWEFPGGKVEAGEGHEAALCRELEEELGILAQACRFVATFDGEPHAKVQLHVYQVLRWQGLPTCRENQPGLLWAPLDKLHTYTFPPANQRILAYLKMHHYAQ